MTGLVAHLQLGAGIGAGFFGEVFAAQCPVRGQVAVKVLRKTPAMTDAEWLARKVGLLQEAQKLQRASHDNVVPVYELVESADGSAILFVMMHCAGGSLQSAFEAGPMPISRVRDIATQVAMGLHALHSRGMIHRDIKPSNILIDGQRIARLGDFGLVTDDLVLGYGSAAGYSDHIAPEVWSGGGTSVRTDIWAFGMTLYRLLHGASWYGEHPAPREVVKDGGFVDTLKWLPHVPKRWRRAIRTMLRDNPADRYQSANQLLAALADLPVLPDWACDVSSSEIRWFKTVGSRRTQVVWKRHS